MKSTLKHLTYSWTGTWQNTTTSGEISAVSVNHAKLLLKQKNIQCLSIQKKKFSWLCYFEKIPLLPIALFFRQLATLVTAGIPLLQCLHILKSEQQKNIWQSIIHALHIDVQHGHYLSTSLKKFPQYFDDFTCQLVQLGERTGTLDKMLHLIAAQKEKSYALKNRIQQILFYPCVVLSLALLIFLILFIFVVPKFEALFMATEHALPWFTQLVLALSHGITDHFMRVIVFSMGIFLIIYFTRKHYAHLYDVLLLKIPLLKTIVSNVIYARLTKNLSITLQSGMPLTDSLTLIAACCGNSFYQQKILSIHKNISAGKQLHHALQETHVFPALMIQMIKVGEESGHLPLMLDQLADVFTSRIDRFISVFSQLLEPLIMLVLGVLIGGILIAMYLPIFQLGTLL